MKPSVRFEIFKRDCFTCRYCGKKSPEAILEVDHVLPESQGGSSEPENLVTACYECNRGKGARLLTAPILGEEDLHEKAVLLAEQERQIEELECWRAKKRQREDRAIKELLARANSIGFIAKDGPFAWDVGCLRTWLGAIGKGAMLDMLDYASAHFRTRNSGERDRASYFAGMCWREIKKGKDEAAPGARN